MGPDSFVALAKTRDGEYQAFGPFQDPHEAGDYAELQHPGKVVDVAWLQTPESTQPRTLVLGIDPGLHGAVALLDGDRVLLLEDLPTVQFSEGRIKNRLDAAGLARMLAPFAGEVFMAIVEKVGARPGEAASGAFSFGYSSGCIAGVLAALNIPTTTVQPAVWKKALCLGSDKDLSRSRALELFPSQAGKLARKKDHDRAESLLLAEWGRRTKTW